MLVLLSKRFSFIFGLTLFLSSFSCVNDDSSSKVLHKEMSTEEQKAYDEYKAELELGRNMAGRLLQYFGQIDSAELIRYINVVGNYVGQYSDAPERSYMFSVLNTETVNAFACPGGYILITKGALRLAETEAELAMILGHEVTHVAKQHMFKTLQKMTKDELEKNAKDAETSESVSPEMKARERPQPEENAAGALLARYLSGSNGAGLNILQAAKAGMSVILDKGLDKKLEFEADDFGVRYAIRSGYEPHALFNYLGHLEKNSRKKTDKNHEKGLNKTHPPIKERLDRIQKLLATLSVDEITGAERTKEFLEQKAKLPPIKP